LCLWRFFMASINTDIQIKPLVLTPEFFAQVAAWHHHECERQGLKSTLALRQQRLQLHIQPDEIPQTLVAVAGQQLLGCVSLVSYRLLAHNDGAAARQLAPVWLTNLFVQETSREQGLGTLLVNAAVSYVSTLDVKEVWLSAAEFTPFYQKRGWEIVRHARLGGRQVNIMRLKITSD